VKLVNTYLQTKFRLSNYLNYLRALIPVGGVIPKILGAAEAGIRKFVVPKNNYDEMADFFQPEVTERIAIVPASTFDEVKLRGKGAKDK
jgi:ATP-dependent Lon protease